MNNNKVAQVGEMRVHDGVVYVAQKATRCCMGCSFKNLGSCSISKECGSVSTGIIWVKAPEESFVVIKGHYFSVHSTKSEGINKLDCILHPRNKSSNPTGVTCTDAPACFNKMFKLIPKFEPGEAVASVKTIDDTVYTKSVTEEEPTMPAPQTIFAMPTEKEITRLQRNSTPFGVLDARKQEILKEALKVNKANVEYFDGSSWVTFKTDSSRFTGFMAYRLTKGCTFKKPAQLTFARLTISELERALKEAEATVFSATAVFSIANGGLFTNTFRHKDIYGKTHSGLISRVKYPDNIYESITKGNLRELVFEGIKIYPKGKLELNFTGV